MSKQKEKGHYASQGGAMDHTVVYHIICTKCGAHLANDAFCWRCEKEETKKEEDANIY